MKTGVTPRTQRLPLVYSRNSVGKGILVGLSYVLLFIALIFSVEIALILLGVGDVVLPWTGKFLELLDRVTFQ